MTTVATGTGLDERTRLEKVYRELGDGELVHMAADPESLTQAGQSALAEEFGRRGLKAPARAGKLDDGTAPLPQITQATAADERADAFGVGVPGMVPAAGAAVEQALEPGGETKLGMTSLVSFYDGMQLAQACDALEAAGIEPAVREIEGDATTGTPSRFEIWVTSTETEQGKTALRSALGLFPLAEGDEALDPDNLAEASDGIVGQYETRAEAEQARISLAEAGFAATVEGDQPGGIDSIFFLKVPPADYPAAFAVLARQLQVE